MGSAHRSGRLHPGRGVPGLAQPRDTIPNLPGKEVKMPVNVIGRYFTGQPGHCEKFAALKDDEMRVMYLNLAASTMHDKPITMPPAQWPGELVMKEHTSETCEAAAIEFVDVGLARQTPDGIILTADWLGKAEYEIVD